MLLESTSMQMKGVHNLHPVKRLVDPTLTSTKAQHWDDDLLLKQNNVATCSNGETAKNKPHWEQRKEILLYISYQI